MLKNIGNGWSELTLIENRDGKEHIAEGVPSYITNVPEDTLRAFIHYFKYGTGTVFYDEEGHEFSLILNRKGLYVLSLRLKSNVYSIVPPDEFHMDIRELAEELCQDIEADIDGWANFKMYTSDDKADIILKNKENLLQMVSELRELAAPQREVFDDDDDEMTLKLDEEDCKS